MYNNNNSYKACQLTVGQVPTRCAKILVRDMYVLVHAYSNQVYTTRGFVFAPTPMLTTTRLTQL